MTLHEIVANLQAFAPSGDETHDASRLYEILDGLEDCPDREDAAPAMFALMERYPGSVLGSPGPLVHELEAMTGYESALRDSLFRQPTYLTVWMANRILNTDLAKEDRQLWERLLTSTNLHRLSFEKRPKDSSRISDRKAAGSAANSGLQPTWPAAFLSRELCHHGVAGHAAEAWAVRCLRGGVR